MSALTADACARALRDDFRAMSVVPCTKAVRKKKKKKTRIPVRKPRTNFYPAHLKTDRQKQDWDRKTEKWQNMLNDDDDEDGETAEKCIFCLAPVLEGSSDWVRHCDLNKSVRCRVPMHKECLAKYEEIHIKCPACRQPLRVGATEKPGYAQWAQEVRNEAVAQPTTQEQFDNLLDDEKIAWAREAWNAHDYIEPILDDKGVEYPYGASFYVDNMRDFDDNLDRMNLPVEERDEKRRAEIMRLRVQWANEVFKVFLSHQSP